MNQGGDPMSTLASRIERYIKDMMDATERNCLELKRKELAEVFSCVPSQINYVLETRFRDEQGYHVVSRRGAGGCFQIIRLEVTEDKEMKDFSLICSVGAITTSAVLGIWSSRKKGIEKIKDWIRVAVLFLAVSITLGKFNILTMIF